MKYKLECALYGRYLNAAAELREAIAKHLRRDNSLPNDLIAEFAAVHAKRYACAVEQNKDGAWRFKDAEGVRDAAAQMQWDRTIDPHHKRVRSSRGGAHESLRKQSDPVRELLAAFWDLTAKQRAEFLARAK
jgi:hypothetical protein